MYMIRERHRSAHYDTDVIGNRSRHHHRREYKGVLEKQSVNVQIEILERPHAARQRYGVIPDQHERLHHEHVPERRASIRRETDETGNENLRNPLGDIQNQRLKKQRPMLFDLLESRAVLLHLVRKFPPPLFRAF